MKLSRRGSAHRRRLAIGATIAALSLAATACGEDSAGQDVGVELDDVAQEEQEAEGVVGEGEEEVEENEFINEPITVSGEVTAAFPDQSVFVLGGEEEDDFEFDAAEDEPFAESIPDGGLLVVVPQDAGPVDVQLGQLVRVTGIVEQYGTADEIAEEYPSFAPQDTADATFEDLFAEFRDQSILVVDQAATGDDTPIEIVEANPEVEDDQEEEDEDA